MTDAKDIISAYLPELILPEPRSVADQARELTKARITEAPGYSYADVKTERRLRHRARKFGLRLHRSRRQFGVDNWGHFQLIDTATRTCILGHRFDATLQDIETWLEQLRQGS